MRRSLQKAAPFLALSAIGLWPGNLPAAVSVEPARIRGLQEVGAPDLQRVPVEPFRMLAPRELELPAETPARPEQPVRKTFQNSVHGWEKAQVMKA